MNKDTLYVVYFYTVKMVLLIFRKYKNVSLLSVDWLTGAGIEPGPRKTGADRSAPITVELILSENRNMGLNMLLNTK